MELSLGGIWARGAGAMAFVSPVLGALVWGALSFVMVAPPDDLFLSEGRFVVDNAVFGAVVGAFVGALLVMPAGVVWTGLFAWAMVRQHRSGAQQKLSTRWQAIVIAGSVQLVALVLFHWAMGGPGGDPRGILAISSVLLLLLTVGVAALLGPWLVRQAERRAARS